VLALSLLLKELGQEKTEVSFWERMDCCICRVQRMWTARTKSCDGTGVGL
jgi:hypothetical protein